MVDDKVITVELQDAFYRDSLNKLVLIIISFCFATFILFLLLALLVLQKPAPVVFRVSEDWLVQPPVPLDKPYLSTPDLLQWANDAVQQLFVLDFNNYDTQVQQLRQYFTQTGWKIYLNQLNNYANYNNVQTNKLFVTIQLQGAPIVLNQGLLPDQYWGWWVQVPVMLRYTGTVSMPSKQVKLQVLIIRVPTQDNLNGVAIDNIMVSQDQGPLS